MWFELGSWGTKEKELFSRSATTFTKIFKCSICMSGLCVWPTFQPCLDCCFCGLKGDAGIVDETIVEKAIHCENSLIWRMLNSCSNGFEVCEALSNSSSTILNSYPLIVKFHLLQFILPLN